MNFFAISPWKRKWPFIWTNLNPHYLRMLCQVCLKLAQSSGEEDFKISLIYLGISLFRLLKKGRVLYVNKLESLLLKDALCLFGRIWSSGSWEDDENVKSVPADRRTESWTDATDNRRSEKFTLAFSLNKWAKKWKHLIIGILFFQLSREKKSRICEKASVFKLSWTKQTVKCVQ